MQLGTITIQAPTQPFLTANEVGKVLGVSAKTIDRWLEAGSFPPPVYLGRERVWSNIAVAAFILWKHVGPHEARGEPKTGEIGDQSE